MQRSLALRLQPAAQAHGAAAADEILSPSRRQPRSKFKPCCVSPGLVGVDSSGSKSHGELPRPAGITSLQRKPPPRMPSPLAPPML